MKSRILQQRFVRCLFSGCLIRHWLRVGKPYIHDPSTIVKCDGKYYTFGTGGGGLISDDGWVWNSGAVRPGAE